MNTKLKEKIKKIKLLIMDVDGILTNGEIVLDEKGKEIKIFDVQDEIEAKRDLLIEKLQTKMKQKTESETLFMIQWRVI